MTDLVEISTDELPTVTGGNFLYNLYGSVLKSAVSYLGGNQLATQMWGADATTEEKHAARAALRSYMDKQDRLPSISLLFHQATGL